MKANRIFLSHSSVDKKFATVVAKRLRESDMEPWIDSENILAGDDILDRLGTGLKKMDLFVFIVSSASLRSLWVEREVKYATLQEIKRKEALVLPFIIDQTSIEELPWYLTGLNAAHIKPDDGGAETLASAVREVLRRRSAPHRRRKRPGSAVCRDERIDLLIKNVGLGDWKSAADAALELARTTTPGGRNDLLQILVSYIDLPDEDPLLWSALHTIECYAEVASSHFDHNILSRMASHQNFSVRSAAASICLRWAQFAPDRIPVDLLIKLSVHDEDWYVEAPANAALKSMASSVREVIGIFLRRLHSEVTEERNHAARNVLEIAEKEAEILDPTMIEAEIRYLHSISDKESLALLVRAAGLTKKTVFASGYKYGL